MAKVKIVYTIDKPERFSPKYELEISDGKVTILAPMFVTEKLKMTFVSTVRKILAHEKVIQKIAECATLNRDFCIVQLYFMSSSYSNQSDAKTGTIFIRQLDKGARKLKLAGPLREEIAVRVETHSSDSEASLEEDQTKKDQEKRLTIECQSEDSEQSASSDGEGPPSKRTKKDLCQKDDSSVNDLVCKCRVPFNEKE